MARVILDSTDTSFTISDDNVTVKGAAGDQTIVVNADVTGLDVDGTIEDVDFSGDLSTYTFKEVAGDLTVYAADGTTVITTITNAAGNTLSFTNGTVNVVGATTIGEAMTLGGVDLTDTAAVVAPAAEDIDDADVSAVDDSTTTPTATPQAFTLTTSADIFTGGTGDDTFTATTATIANTDILIDATSTDNDTLNMALTAAYTDGLLKVVSGIENINIDWQATTAAAIDIASITTQNLEVSSTTFGYGGALNLDNVNDTVITLVNDVDGTIDIDGGKTSSVTATAGTLTVDGTATLTDNLSATVVGGTSISVGKSAGQEFIETTVTANASTTTIAVDAQGGLTTGSTVTATGGAATTSITIADANTITVDAGAALTVSASSKNTDTVAHTSTITANSATAVTVDGTAAVTDVATITLGAAAVTLDTSAVQSLETVNLTVAADSEITIANDSIFNTMNVISTGAVKLIAGSDELTTLTVTDGTTGLSIDLTQDAAAVLTDVDATINLTTSHASALTVADSATVNLIDEGLDAAQTFVVTAIGTEVHSINIGVTDSITNTITTKTVDTTNVNIVKAADVTAAITLDGIDSEGDINITSDTDTILSLIDANTAANDVVINVDGDLTATVGGAIDAASIDASGTTGDAAITQGTANTEAMTITGAQGDNTIIFTAATDASIYTGSEGIDDVTLATTDSSVVLQSAGGNDVIKVASLTTGSAVIATGEGDDLITIGNAGTLDGATITVDLGEGTDKITITDTTNTLEADFTLNVKGGTTGIDTVSFADAQDATGATLTFEDIEVIELVTAVESIFSAAQMSGKDYTIASSASQDAEFTVGKTTINTDTTIDLSTLTVDQGIGTGMLVVDINAGDGTNTITGTDGALTVDTIVTGSGVDTIMGMAGADVIDAGAGADAIDGGAGADSILQNAADTGVATAGTTATSTTTLDVIAFGAGDDLQLLGLETDTGYDTFVTIDDASVISLAVTAEGGTQAGTVSLITGIYDAATDVFTSTAVATSTDVMISYAKTNLGTAATDSVILTGVATAAELAIADGVITFA